MFLLPRLHQLSPRFAADVEGIRDFLLDRGIPAGSVAALTQFSARLAIDPSFRRDLTSLLQVVIRREDQVVDYMDLLGILVAAAVRPGPFNATSEQEESVRDLLRFLTEVPQPSEAALPVFVRSQNVIPAVAAAAPPVPERAHEVDWAASFPATTRPFLRLEESTPFPRNRTALWVAAAMALAIALGSVWMLHPNHRATPPAATAPHVAPSPAPSATNQPPELATPPAEHIHTSRPVVLRKPAPVVRHFGRSPIPLPEPTFSQPALTVRNLPPLETRRSVPPAPSPAPAAPTPLAESHPITTPSPRPTESATNTPPSVDPYTRSAPPGRRRLPKSVVINPGPLRHPGGSSGSLAASGPGVVHPASIGMMASNLISSPAPPYPAAAAQARVQGEVTVRAVVDREGRVIDARVVSGPELLRDVSLEAVQHWRYRPYMQRGQPVEVATTAVLDFELP